MHINSSFPKLVMSAVLLVGAPLFAQNSHGNPHGANKVATASSGKLIPVTEKDASWAAKERKSYPLDVCVTSDEKLGSMGKSPEYIYRVDGKPDRLVVFCCEGCEEDFMKEPSKYLAKIDAAKAKGAPAKKPAGAKGHGEQHE
jgi:hypothetical protein